MLCLSWHGINSLDGGRIMEFLLGLLIGLFFTELIRVAVIIVLAGHGAYDRLTTKMEGWLDRLTSRLLNKG